MPTVTKKTSLAAKGLLKRLQLAAGKASNVEQVVIENCHLPEGITLVGSNLKSGLVFRNCEFDGPIDLSHATIPHLAIEDCRFRRSLRTT